MIYGFGRVIPVEVLARASSPPARGVSRVWLVYPLLILAVVLGNILISGIFAALAVWGLGWTLGEVSRSFPTTLVYFDAVLSVGVVAALLFERFGSGILWTLLRLVGLYMLYWQAVLGIYLFDLISENPEKVDLSGFLSFLDGWLPAFDNLMMKPGWPTMFVIVNSWLVFIVSGHQGRPA